VPKREIPNKKSESSRHGPEDIPVVDVGGGVQDFRPEETLAKGVSNRLALPNYESTVKPKCLGEREIHTLFQEQSPQWSSTA
jgi:hypothetical protein